MPNLDRYVAVARTLVVIGVAVALGCRDGSAPTDESNGRALWIDPDTVRLRLGDVYRMRIRTRYDESLRDLQIFVGDGSAVTTDNVGVLRTVRPGLATVYVNATADGTPASAHADVVVVGVAFDLSELSPINVGQRVQATWHVYSTINGNGDQRVRWRSSDSTIIAVTPSGAMTMRAPGTAVITAVALADTLIRATSALTVVP